MTPWKPVAVVLLLLAVAPLAAGAQVPAWSRAADLPDVCYEVQRPLDPPHLGPCQIIPLVLCKINPAACSSPDDGQVDRSGDACAGVSSTAAGAQVQGSAKYWCLGVHLSYGRADCVGWYERGSGAPACTASLGA